MIAPSHGIIWRKYPMRIVEKYYEWAKGINNKAVVIIYNSMWGATKKMAEYIGVGLELSEVSYKIYNVATADKNDVLTEIFKAKGLICGSSTINYGILSALSGILCEFKGLKYIDKVGQHLEVMVGVVNQLRC